GSLSAYVGAGSGDSTRVVAQTLLTVRKETDGRWRIATEAQTATPASLTPVSAKDLVALLDAAGIRRAVVLSVAYTWDSPNHHVEQLRRVFHAANAHRMAIVVHMRASFARGLPYGANEARIFLNEILPAAPDVPVQIAHLAGGGGYEDQPALDALAFFADAIA